MVLAGKVSACIKTTVGVAAWGMTNPLCSLFLCR